MELITKVEHKLRAKEVAHAAMVKELYMRIVTARQHYMPEAALADARAATDYFMAQEAKDNNSGK